jgi:uncharacterized protein YbcI
MQDDSGPVPKLAPRHREAGPPADLESASGMSEADTPTAVRNAVSQAMSRVKREYYGKGPARTRTYIFDTVVFSILDDVLTPVELALKERGRGELVRHVRLTFQDIMTRAFTEQVEQATGARVIAYHSQLVYDPDMAIEIFVLDRPVTPGAVAEPVALARPGAVGDADDLPSGPRDRPVVASRRQDGQVRAAIADAMVRLTREHWGKGPVRAKAYLEDQFVFAVLEDPLTTVERTLIDGGEQALVRRLRQEFQEVANPAFAAEVEKATGRRVLTGHAQVVFDPDIVFEVFVLED